MSTDVAPVPRRFRLTAFRAGAIAGIATLAAVTGAFVCLGRWLEPSRPYNVELLANGADITRLGGRWLAIDNSQDGTLVAVTCNGACDDLGYRLKTVEDEDVKYRVRVQDGKACIACGGFTYVQPPFGSPPLSRWTLAGAAKLDPWPQFLEFGPNGTFVPIEPAEATAN